MDFLLINYLEFNHRLPLHKMRKVQGKDYFPPLHRIDYY